MKITIESKQCTRCEKNIFPKISDEDGSLVFPITCRYCKSPYWQKDYIDWKKIRSETSDD